MCSISSEVIQSFQVSTDVIRNFNHNGNISIPGLYVLNVRAPRLFTRFFLIFLMALLSTKSFIFKNCHIM
jgi:hypothetical protein